MTEATNNATATSKRPSHNVYHVRDSQSGKGFWTRVGSAWTHSDDKGFSIQIDVVPLDGRITVRVADEKTAQ